MVRAIQIPSYGGPEVFRLVENPDLPLAAGDVRIEVHAAGVNFADVMMRMGAYPEAPKRPFTPGYEVAGVVTEIGPDVTGLAVGERVVSACRFGGYVSSLVVSASQVWKIPAHLSFEEAASIPVNFITAWIALEEMARVRAGDRVLIHSAAGGVGVAAIQLASRRGAHITGLTSSPGNKSDFIRSLGAHEVISVNDWENPAIAEKRFGLFNTILDSTGGASLKRSYRRLAPGGRLVQYGASAMISGNRRSLLKAISTLARMPIFLPLRLMNDNKGVFGVNVLQLFDPEKRALPFGAMNQVMELFEKRELRAQVGKTFPLAEAGAAQAFLQSRAATGKVVLTCNS
jgi:synaptic vesicle membrane protein VAT-1